MKELSETFNGKGEVKGDAFTQLKKSEKAFMYKRTSEANITYYEVFKRKENSMYNCVSYPSSKAFGLWAWCIKDLNKAEEKFNLLNQ